MGTPVPLVEGGVGHRAQPLGLHYVVGRWGGSGAGLDGDGDGGILEVQVMIQAIGVESRCVHLN